MGFNNSVTVCTDDFSSIYNSLSSVLENLRNVWEGSAANKFFTDVDLILGICDIVKLQFVLLKAAALKIDELEKIMEEMKTKYTRRDSILLDAELYNIEQIYQQELDELNEDLQLLTKQKKDLIKQIEEYFGLVEASKCSDSKSSFDFFITPKVYNESFEMRLKKTEEKLNDKEDIVQKAIADIYASKVNTVVSDTSTFNNDAAPGQCVWFARGRVTEKFGFETRAMGDGKNIAKYCPDQAKLAPTKDNIKADILVSYEYGTGSGGQKFGHVIYIEAAYGEKVYYTECTTLKNGIRIPAGTVKETTKDDILNGTAGCGTVLNGFVDVKKLRNAFDDE